MDSHDELPPAETARAKRRDRDAEARSRAGMQSGLAKQFKQVLDAQVKRAREVGPAASEHGPADDEPRPRKSGRSTTPS
jgi:hypothetical protein